MKTEDQAWRDLQAHASAQLHRGFADQVLRVAHGPRESAWRELHLHAAAQLRPGFAERVLRVARAATEVPSFLSQLALSAATAAVCLAAVIFVQDRDARQSDERNLADWERIVLVAQDYDSVQ